MTFKREAWVTYGALVPVVAGVVIASGVSLFVLFSILLTMSVLNVRFPGPP
jgi:hypothetical protein